MQSLGLRPEAHVGQSYPWVVTEGEAVVGEVRLERMGRRGVDHREAQMLCVEKITLVTGGEWALCGRGQGDP